MSFAKATITGTVVSDPEKRFTPNNHAVTSFNISAENPPVGSRPAEPFTLKVTCWRNLGEAVTVLQKGDSVLVDGKLILNAFQAQDGSQKKQFELEANSVERIPGKPEPILATNSESTGNYEASSNRAGQPPKSSFSTPPGSHFSSEELLTEDDIPF